MSSASVVKLSTGEELIGTVTPVTDGYLIKGVVQLGMVDNGMAFIKYMPYSNTDQGITLKHDHVMFIVPMADELQPSYQAATGKVVTPPKKLILGGS
jgi:hypothetical protein